MKRYILSLLMCGALLPLKAQVTQQVRPGVAHDAGITYSLPRTLLQATVKAQCSNIKAGPLAQYAEKYLGITDAPQEDAVVWQITGIEINPLAKPDAERTYHVVTTGQVPSISLTPQGFLQSINCEVQATQPVEEVTEAEAEKKSLRAVSVLSEEMLRAGSKNKQAEIAARQIFRIRESRLNLLTGEVDNLPADGASFQLVLDNLEAQEKAYLELFTGVTTITTEERNFEYDPVEVAVEQLLFRFSSHYGFVEADDMVGEPYDLSIEVLEDNRQPMAAEGKSKGKANGIAYCVPGKAGYKLTLRGKALAYGQMSVAQLGRVERLANNQFTDKKNPAKAIFDPITGSIKQYE